MDLNLESVFTDPDLGLGSVGGGGGLVYKLP